MTSPDVFLSSPRSHSRRASILVNSSSPGLPPVELLTSQTLGRPPAFKSGSKAKPIPDEAVTSFTSVREHWKAAQAIEALPVDLTTIDHDTATPVEVPAPVKKARKPRKRAEPKAKSVTTSKATPDSPSKDPSWKKYKKGPNAAGSTQSPDVVSQTVTLARDDPQVKTATRKTKQTGVMSTHFTNEPSKVSSTTSKTVSPDEPLCLEQAIARRLDWTPPVEKKTTYIDLDTEASAHKSVSSSAADAGMLFTDLQHNFGHVEVAPADVTATSDEDSGFLKKRKLIELVTTRESSNEKSPAPEKSPMKQKAPKKKPRTITEVATAAYRVRVDAEEEAPPPASILNYVTSEVQTVDPAVDVANEKGKGKARLKVVKKSTKPRKKKAGPPKTVLLSPDAALREVAKQNFLFGTSSQLVREQSPTLLRDIQFAIKHSNEVEEDPFATTINSDAIEPVEQRPKLWNAGARDAGGDLFDVEIIDLVNGPAPAPGDDESDPFGYSMTESKPTFALESVDLEQAELPTSAGETSSEAIAQPLTFDNMEARFSSSQISASTDIQKKQTTSGDTKQVDEMPSITIVDAPIPAPKKQPPRPKYELYTDVQLSKAVKSFGFKPVKRRTTMLALLDQCWQSKVRLGQPSSRAASTVAKAAITKPDKKPTKAKGSTESPKKPRGRPRKNSINSDAAGEVLPVTFPKKARGRPRKDSITVQPDVTAHSPTRSVDTPKKPRGRPRKDSLTISQMQEPPPSAQPIESARPRGRPRKSSLASSEASPTRTKRSRKAVVATSPARPRTPMRKAVGSKLVIEIPDSASDSSSSALSSPLSSPGSPSVTVDLSASLENEADMSLVMSSTDQQASMFLHISKAVTTAPRTTDPANPSWHEKILLYDPIVLEDLAGWLNSGQLGRVGYDNEVSAAEVKKWCESNSICCLWRVSLRGKERKRY